MDELTTKAGDLGVLWLSLPTSMAISDPFYQYYTAVSKLVGTFDR
ncbi:hypothetical protein [Paenibacillus macquariensis]|nr:hypothetical protein [Paenibacillus macquariensis]MEC0092573.1 hypothetical protein [Paenibacillus macquariensis]